MGERGQLPTGFRLGPYEVVRRIGAGGMGTVYEGRDTRLDRTVAIKAAAGDFSGRLEREARAVSALNHPHICTLYDIVEEGGAVYLVMEYVQGGTLADRLQQSPLPFADVLRYGAEIAGALAAAHAGGIVHRDLKPANIMLTGDGVKVLDFGLAKLSRAPSAGTAVETLTAPQTVVGTLHYMAPEQLEGKECDERADIFALGLVLYEMAAGRKAFEAESSAGLIAQIMRCEPEPLKAGTPQFRRTVRRCLMKDPAQRWHSAADVKIDLEEPAPAEEAAPAAALRPRRWPAVLGIAAGLLIGFLVAALWPMQPSPFPAVTPFATEFEVQTMPSWSPKGDRIAYVAAVDGVFQVFTKALTASSPTQRTTMKDPCLSPFWSADGNRIYYFSRQALWSVPLAGGAPEKVLEPARKAALSPDGQRMAVMNPRLAFASPPGSPPVLYEPFKARNPGFPHLEFTRDGAYLGQLVIQQGQVVFTKIPVNGGPHREFTTKAMGFVDAFTWLPGGDRIVVSGVPGAQELRATDFQLALWDLASGRFRQLTDDTTLGEFPALAPDGRTLAYAQGRQDYDLVEVPLDRSGAVRSVLETSRNELAPCWSPSGTHFAYATDRSGQFEMRVRDRRDGSERVIVAETDFPGGTITYYSCSFSPDGRRLAINTYQRATFGMWVATLSGEAPVPLLPKLQAGPAPAWSPDGQWIAYYGVDQGKPALMKITAGGREPQTILPRNTALASSAPAWSPKGDWIAFGGIGGIRAVSPDGQRTRTISEHSWLGFDWAKDGNALFGIFGDENRRLKLARIDAATAQESVLADLGPQLPATSGGIAHGHGPYSAFAIHPDGKSALLCLMRLNKAIYLMRDFDRPVRLIDRLLRR